MSSPPSQPSQQARLTLLVHGSTAATAAAAFPADEPLEARAVAAATAVGSASGTALDPALDPALDTALRRADHRVRGPERACSGTCDALGATATVEHDLRGWDPGRWSGRTLDEVAAADPPGLRAWLDDPDADPHGGGSLTGLLERVGHWLAARPPGHTLAVCAPSVARAAVVVAMGAPPSAFWRLDASPLTVTDLRSGPSRWTVRATGSTPR